MESNYALRAFELMRAELPNEDTLMVWLYTLLALTTGRETSLENVHDAWSLWKSFTYPNHPSIIPFDQLNQKIQELDEPYASAIHRAANKLAKI